MKKEKIIIIVGPTGSGKSNLGIELARLFNGEIISADSMQIYKDMNIGTAKITKEEMCGIPHHLLDIVDPTENFNVKNWKDFAEEKISYLKDKNKLPIIVGGTCLYVNALINNYSFGNEETKDNNRTNYQKFLNDNGIDALYELLNERCPEIAQTVDKNKTRAIIRYLEIIDNGGDPTKIDEDKQYDYLLIGLNSDRELIYNRINERVDEMISAGLENEINNLIKHYGFNKNLQSGQAIGYREFWGYFEGEYDKNKCIELIKQHSRNYAKRQLTFMRKMENLEWFEKSDTQKIIKRVKEFLGE